MRILKLLFEELQMCGKIRGLRRLACTLTILSFATSAFAEESIDEFGFQKFYETKEGTYSWTSVHWANGHERTFTDWSGDADDPLLWTDDRSSDGGGFKVDGKGVMQMLGDGPRFHINGQISWTEKKQFFLNTEYTAYFMRDALGGKDYGGMVVGVRSGALGHASGGGNNCDANTYYARFRNDGKWDFEKEWKHPASYWRSGTGVGHQDPLWGGEVLPVGKWIGMKYIIYNKDESTVRLELYIDSTSNANPPGKWELVGIAEDAGEDWPGAEAGAAKIEGCKDYNGLENSYEAILKGGGVVLMRSDSDHPYYKFVSVREIDPSKPVKADSGTTGLRKNAKPNRANVKIRHFDLLGRAGSGKKTSVLLKKED